MKNKEIKVFTFQDLFNFFWKRKIHFIVIGIITIVLASVFSGEQFIKPKYKSTAVFFPATTNSISAALLPEQGQRSKDPLEFGAEEDAEKALQILQSAALKERLIKNFNLMEHYGIDPKKTSYPRTKLDRKLNSNISYTRTRYLSVRIDVLDYNPEKAAELARGIMELYDTVKNEIQQERAVKSFEIVERAMKEKEREIALLHRQIEAMGELGVTNYEEETRAIAEAINEARLAGKDKIVNELLQKQKEISKLGGQFMSLKDKITLEEIKLSDIVAKYDRAKIDVEETLTHMFKVSEPFPAERKSYPVRWLIVLVSLIVVTAVWSVIFAFYDAVVKNKKPVVG